MRRAGVMPNCGFSRSTRYGKACSTPAPRDRIVAVRRRGRVGPVSIRQFRPLGWGAASPSCHRPGVRSGEGMGRLVGSVLLLAIERRDIVE